MMAEGSTEQQREQLMRVREVCCGMGRNVGCSRSLNPAQRPRSPPSQPGVSCCRTTLAFPAGHGHQVTTSLYSYRKQRRCWHREWFGLRKLPCGRFGLGPSRRGHLIRLPEGRQQRLRSGSASRLSSALSSERPSTAPLTGPFAQCSSRANSVCRAAPPGVTAGRQGPHRGCQVSRQGWPGQSARRRRAGGRADRFARPAARATS